MADKVRHLRSRPLKRGWGWYWIPSAHVAAFGLVAEALGETPEKIATPAILKRAIDLNALADELRLGRSARAEQDAPGTIGFLVKEYRASVHWFGLKPRTRDDYAPWLDALRDDYREFLIGDMDGLVLETWRDRVAEERGLYAAYHMLGTMRAIFAWATRRRLIPKGTDPAKEVENRRPPKRTHTWTLKQICAFLDAAFGAGEYGFWAAMILTDCIAQSPVDVWGLARSDYDGKSILKGRRTKVAGEHPPMVLWPHVVTALDWYLSTRPALLPDAPLFAPPGANTPWVTSTRHKIFQRLRKAAGLPATLQWQDMRRTGATEAGAAGGTGIEIKGLLRHQTLSEASTYTLDTATSLRIVQSKRMTARARNKDEC
jgi:hypothetical protein